MSEYASEEERWEELREPGCEPDTPSDFKPEEGEDAGFRGQRQWGIASCSSSAAATA